MDTKMPHSISISMDIEDGREVHIASVLSKDGYVLMEADMSRSPSLYKFLVTICLNAEDHKTESFENGSNVMTAVLPAGSEDKNWREACYAGSFYLSLFEIAKETDVTGSFQTIQDDDGNFVRMAFTK